MRIFLKTEDEIGLMRRANRLVADTLAQLAHHIKPGVTTLQLDTIAEAYIRDNGGVPSFKNCPNPFGGPFPGSICTSINRVVVHGIPSAKVFLKEGDVVSIDCGAILDGYNGDSCYTFCVGEVDKDVRQLLKTTKEALYNGIQQAVPGKHLGDIGWAVQNTVEPLGYGVVRELTGHGIGREMHEDPPVPNYGEKGHGVMLKAGMCIAIEPMITMGDHKIWLMPDKWTIITRDGKPAAHFEHTIAIRNQGPEILSSFSEIEKIEGQQY